MAEWLALLLLVPVIVAPVVLLVGFAGCSVPEFRVRSGSTIDSADGQDVITIRLTWHSDFPESDLEFERTILGLRRPGDTRTFDAQPSPFDDTDGLEAEQSYSYILRRRDAPDTASPSVIGTTLGFETTFDETDETGPPSVDQGPLQSVTLVQRIEAAALTPISRTQIKQARITLFASSASSDASIDAIFISRASSAAGANPYDSDAADLTEVPLPATPLVVPAGMPVPPVTLVVDYITDPGQALLIAVDFSAVPAVSAVRVWTPVPDTVAWARSGPPEAAVATRSGGYNMNPSQIALIGKIEIG